MVDDARTSSETSRPTREYWLPGGTTVTPSTIREPTLIATQAFAVLLYVCDQGGNAEPRTYSLPSATHREQAPATPGPDSATPGPEPTTVGNGQSGGSGTAPQAITDDLADTGARLWPAAIGGVLLLVGSVLLRRIRRRTW